MTHTAGSDGRSGSSNSNTLLQSIDAATLTPLVRQVLGSDGAEVVDLDYQAMHRGAGWGNLGGTAVYRVCGTARDEDWKMDWSLILKIFYPPAREGRPSDWNYWRREVDAYQSGWLDHLPGGVAAPRCFSVVEQPDGACWIWMEEVKDDIGSKWPLEHYGIAARCLGRFGAAYLTGHPLPTGPWVSSGWLRGAVAHAADAFRLYDESEEGDIVRRWCPPDEYFDMLRLWPERERFLGALDRLPQTLCHFDAFKGNLFSRKTADGDEELVAIDWALVGPGAMGVDIGSLLAHGRRAVGQSRAQELFETVVEGYLEGLRDGGWEAERWQVRLGCCARGAMNRLIAFGQAVPGFHDARVLAQLEQQVGRSAEEWADRRAALRRSFPGYDWAGEARALLGLV